MSDHQFNQPEPGDWDTPFRYIRDEKGDYGIDHFRTREERDTAGKAYAKSDGQDVLLEFCDDNGVWWLEEVAYAPGNEPAPVDYSKRFSADAALPGDTITVFGCEATWESQTTEWGAVKNSDHTGTVMEKMQIDLPYTDWPGWRIRFDDGRAVDCIGHAVTTMHEMSDNITKEA